MSTTIELPTTTDLVVRILTRTVPARLTSFGPIFHVVPVEKPESDSSVKKVQERNLFIATGD